MRKVSAKGLLLTRKQHKMCATLVDVWVEPKPEHSGNSRAFPENHRSATHRMKHAVFTPLSRFPTASVARLYETRVNQVLNNHRKGDVEVKERRENRRERQRHFRSGGNGWNPRPQRPLAARS